MPIELKCSACGTMVCVPDVRLGDDPRCSACGAAIAPGMVGVDLGRLFQGLLATSPPPERPAALRPWPTLLRIALRSSGLGDAVPQRLASRRERFACGLLGIAAGAAASVVGAIGGTLVMNTILAAMGVAELRLPTFVVSAAYFGALWGGLVSIAGIERVLGAAAPSTDATAGVGRVLRLATLIVAGSAELLGLWMLMHALDLANFSLK